MEQHFRSKEAAEYAGITPELLTSLCRGGNGPVRFFPSDRVILYRRSDLDAWMRAWQVDEPAK